MWSPGGSDSLDEEAAGPREGLVGEIAKSLSEELAQDVERSGASVVRVAGRRGPSSGIVWSREGVIVTAHHALEWDEGVEVSLPDGAALPATVVGRDPTTDIAALRVAASDLAVPAWADAETTRVGQVVLAVSRPGRSVRASLGIVSVRGDSWRTPAGGRLDHYLQTDIARHPGFSGSLLAAAGGAAIGLNTSGLLRGTTLAVTASTLRRVMEALLAHGQVRRGYLGLGTYPVRLPAELERAVGQDLALLIVSVEPDSPAARAGLKLGDALAVFDGHHVRHPSDLLPLLDGERIGAEVPVRIVRAGEVKDVRLTVGTREARG
jgi:S1-C subfamily serine protease